MFVAIGVPSTGAWKPKMGQDLVNMCCRSMVEGITVGVYTADNAYISEARNELVKGALDNNADYLLFIDSDMGFPDDALIRLLRHDKDIVNVAYRRRWPPYELMRVGAGFMLIKTEVFKKSKYPWFYESHNDKEGLVGEDVNFIRNNGCLTDMELSKDIVHIGNINVGYERNN